MTNVFVFTGRITKDLEVKEVGSGTKVLNFSLAVDNPFKKDDTSFFDIVAFNQKAETLARYCGKGSKIAVNGDVKQERFKDKEGNNRSAVRFTASNIEFLDSKGQSENQPQQQAQPNQQQTKSNSNPFANANGPIDISEDDMPF
ncbi:single-stranded DNA-binding protein [Staphylococcus equorum]|uniref:single-stranded DNA-binding protein n=1 Tax=Staphylococcus equorum TaxID=246432 RepID=UPI003CF446A8